MSVDFAGAAVGTAFGELFVQVKEVVKTIALFREQLEKIESTLDSIVPIMKDINEYNRRMDRKDTRKIQDLINDGKDMVEKCLKIKAIQLCKRYKYSKKLTKFDATLFREFQLSVPLMTARNTVEILEGVEVMGGEVKEVGKDVKGIGENVNEIRGDVEDLKKLLGVREYEEDVQIRIEELSFTLD